MPGTTLSGMTEDAKHETADDVKAKMREALERKKQAQGRGPAASAGGRGSVGAAHEKAGGKREFRRKSS